MLAQLLLVLSDDDLHVRGTPFSPAAARAVATSLNGLVYRTHFPRAPPAATGQRVAGGVAGACAATLPRATLAAGASLLQAWAPVALRGLYERDQRRPYASSAGTPGFWTAPWDADASQQGSSAAGSDGTSSGGGAAEQQRRSGGAGHSGLRGLAAVVQGLLSGSARDTGGSAGTSQPQPPADASRGGGTGRGTDPGLAAAVAGAPSAMTALLRSAPQCVPFDVRVQLFRQVLAEDRARGRWDVPAAEGGPRPLKLTVRRGALLEDAYAALAGKGDALKGRLFVSFVNDSGLEEAGLDHGGLTKELLEAAVAASLAPGCVGVRAARRRWSWTPGWATGPPLPPTAALGQQAAGPTAARVCTCRLMSLSCTPWPPPLQVWAV